MQIYALLCTAVANVDSERAHLPACRAAPARPRCGGGGPGHRRAGRPKRQPTQGGRVLVSIMCGASQRAPSNDAALDAARGKGRVHAWCHIGARASPAWPQAPLSTVLRRPVHAHARAARAGSGEGQQLRMVPGQSACAGSSQAGVMTPAGGQCLYAGPRANRVCGLRASRASTSARANGAPQIPRSR